VVGGVLAAAGQAALTHALPLASEGANVLKLGVQELLGRPPSAPAPSMTSIPAIGTPTIGPVAAEPRPVDVGELVKAADRHRRAAQAAAPSTAGADARAPASAPAQAPTPAPAIVPRRAPATPRLRPAPDPPAPRTPGGDVQMVTGRVTSGFGVRWGQLHRGLDIAAPVGTPIHAPMAGEVVASGPASGFGLWVRLRHADGTVTTYGHVNRTLVRVGQHVAAGEEIAEVGNRGQSTGPHLHVEVQTPGGTTVNPRPWLDAHGIGY
jgi:murein DD-endopeptidase MepM/ murein hydrolase activator NlpD